MINNRDHHRYNKLVTFASFIMILFIVAFGYSYFQYSTSKHQSEIKIQQHEQIDELNREILTKEPIEFQAEKTVKNQPINVLLVGIDTSEENLARTDTIMIAQYRPKDGTLKLASIMRDSYVAIPGHNKNKINASFFLAGLNCCDKRLKIISILIYTIMLWLISMVLFILLILLPQMA